MNGRSDELKLLVIDYRFSRNASMTSAIFSDYFKHPFVMQVRYLPEKKKTLLLVGNCTGHSVEELASEDDQFTIILLPPNTIALIRPMDLEFSLKDVVLLLSHAWSIPTSQTVEKSWHKILSKSSFEDKSIDEYKPDDLI
ncbi:hypothetical protein Trydic_g13825 [Trypoxylus dichotomus]